jgi:predicted RNase H-like HicB family nuclease
VSVEALIKEVHAQQLRVNNIFELDNGRWRANLRRERDCFSFGDGDTPAEALRAALADAEQFTKTLEKAVAHKALRTEFLARQNAEEDIFG